MYEVSIPSSRASLKWIAETWIDRPQWTQNAIHAEGAIALSATDEEGPKTGAAAAFEIANFNMPPMVQGASHIEASDANTARAATVEKLNRILEGFLRNGMMASRLRKGEVDRGIMTLTDAVRLHLAYQIGEDFKLEIWLCPSSGRDITEAKADSFARLRTVLGDYLFKEMSTSNWCRHAATTSDTLSAVNVSFPHGDSGDCKLEVMLNFEAGRYLLDELYPS